MIHTRRGEVVYACFGSGPAALLLHGGMGGWDQAVHAGVSLLAPGDALLDLDGSLRDGDALLRGRFGLIAPSRAGYLRTPLSSGRTPEEAADAMAALLDDLRVDRALVIGISGGGPTALQFAIRQPNRTAALMLGAAISHRHVQPTRTTANIVARIVFARGFGWFLDLAYAAGLACSAVRPLAVCRQLLYATETFDRDRIRQRMSEIARHPDQIRWLRGLLQCGYPLSLRKAGVDNDLKQFAAIDHVPLDRIQCPTLVLHARHDGNVPFEDAEFVARGIAGAEMVVAESCGHLIWLSEEYASLRRAALTFLERHGPSASQRV